MVKYNLYIIIFYLARTVKMCKGKIIVLDGLDGCGKSTQLKLAEGFFKKSGVNCRTISFPNYDSLSGKLILEYLKGNIPCEDENGAYAASALYAVDRYISYCSDWKEFYNKGGVILCGRYTTSNAIYQLTKIAPANKQKFLNWLFDFEYDKLGLPEPDSVLYLDMPVEVSQKLLTKRYGGDENQKDIHEKNVKFLNDCRESAMYTAKRCHWNIIDCSENGEPRSIEEIQRHINEFLRSLF